MQVPTAIIEDHQQGDLVCTENPIPSPLITTFQTLSVNPKP